MTTAYNRITGDSLDKVSNSAGGRVFKVTPLQQLERFLVLGSVGGTYYVDADTLTDSNVKNVKAVLDSLGVAGVETIVAVSEAGRNVKQEPVLLALAIAASHKDEAVRKTALAALPRVARTGTMLYQFNEFVEKFRGRGSALNRAVRNCITGDVERVAFQAVKYQSRNGWSFKDLLRLTKPVPGSEAEGSLFAWAVGKPYSFESLPRIVQGFELAKRVTSAAQLIRVINEYGLPWEAVPTQYLKDPEVWEALLPNIGLTAVVRNLRRFKEIGLTTATSAATKSIVSKLTDPSYVAKSRVHPYSLLVAHAATKGSGPAPITVALNKAFYLAFDNVEPTGKRTFIGLDISGSMDSPVVGTPSKRGNGAWQSRTNEVSCRDASTAMALVTLKAESDAVDVYGFDSGAGNTHWNDHRNRSGIRKLNLTSDQRLDDAITSIGRWGGGATDCSLPFEHALSTGAEYDAFIIYTDSETWSGKRDVDVVLAEYRRKVVPGAKLVVVGMTSTGFTIGDPKDPGVLNVVGFDTAAPKAISEFIRS